MPLLAQVVVKSSDAIRPYWFIKPDCGEFASVVSFQKLTSNSTMTFSNCVVNDAQLTDCTGNVYEIGKVIVATLNGGTNEKNETCKIVYTTTSGETDSFLFNVKIDDRG